MYLLVLPVVWVFIVAMMVAGLLIWFRLGVGFDSVCCGCVGLAV